MISPRTLVLVALLPVTALAQAKSLEAARGARKTANEANAGIQQQADAVQEPAAAARAPADAGEPAPEGDAAAPGTLDAGPGEGAAAAADEGAGSVPAPDTYTVRPGDTLWDLSGRFLNNPWYWPKVWSYNPEITNPNWIYPGNVIRFYPSAEEAPARVEPVAEAAPEAQEPEAEAPRELEDFSKADMKAPASADESDTVAVVGPYKIGYTAPKATLARDVTFVTAGELAQSGKLTGAFEEKIMLTALDRTYAKFEGKAPVKKGESYLVYKTERPIYHPRTNELLGYQSTVLGTAKVTALDDTAVSLVITNALYPIERGALLGPWTDRIVRSVKRKPNQKALDGTIVATQYEVVTEIGEHHLVFVDRGKTDGVEVGNVFTVVRSGDPYGKPPKAPLREAGYPKEDVGDLLVIDAQDEVSTTLVVRSMRELAIGDEVEMRPAGGAGSN
jgi:hypothetical protein